MQTREEQEAGKGKPSFPVRGNVTVPFTIVSGYVIWEQFFVPGRKRKANSENHKWKRITDLM